jgi:hypothetical protein
LLVFEGFGVDVLGEGVLEEIEVDFDFEGDFEGGSGLFVEQEDIFLFRSCRKRLHQ